MKAGNENYTLIQKSATNRKDLHEGSEFVMLGQQLRQVVAKE